MTVCKYLLPDAIGQLLASSGGIALFNQTPFFLKTLGIGPSLHKVKTLLSMSVCALVPLNDILLHRDKVGSCAEATHACGPLVTCLPMWHHVRSISFAEMAR